MAELDARGVDTGLPGELEELPEVATAELAVDDMGGPGADCDDDDDETIPWEPAEELDAEGDDATTLGEFVEVIPRVVTNELPVDSWAEVEAVGPG